MAGLCCRRNIFFFVFIGFSCVIISFYHLNDELAHKLIRRTGEKYISKHRHNLMQMPRWTTNAISSFGTVSTTESSTTEKEPTSTEPSTTEKEPTSTEPSTTEKEPTSTEPSTTEKEPTSTEPSTTEKEPTSTEPSSTEKESTKNRVTTSPSPPPPVVTLMEKHSWSHVYGDKNCSENSSRKKLFQPLFKKWTEMAKEHNIQYTLACGSLLGAMRTADIIPWDYDLDIMVESKYFPIFKKLAMTRNFSLSDGKMRFVIQPEYEKYKVTEKRRRFTCDGKLTPSMVDYCSFQDPMARLLLRNKYIDMYPLYVKGDIVEDTSDERIRIYKTEDMFPLRPCKFMEIDALCPYRPWKILTTYFNTKNLEARYKCRNNSWVNEKGEIA